MIDPDDATLTFSPEDAPQRLADGVRFLTAAFGGEIDRAKPPGDVPTVNRALLSGLLEVVCELLDRVPGGRDAALAELGMLAARRLAGFDE